MPTAAVVALATLALIGGVRAIWQARSHRPVGPTLGRTAVSAVAVMVPLMALGTTGGGVPAQPQAIVAGVDLATASDYSVLGGSTVTNTGPSVLGQSLGLWPGTSVTGFPPGLVSPPGTIDVNAVAQQAQSDLTAAYVDAAGRPVDATTTADLGNQILQPGVYAGPDKSALGLTGPLVLDADGNSSAVWIFQTDSTLITASGSTVSLINGASACNVYWQVGSSATLGTSSVFVGNIMALTSVTVNTGVTVEGRALARNGAVTLDTDTFTEPDCSNAPPTTTTSSIVPSSTSTSSSIVPSSTTTSSSVVPSSTTTTGGGTSTPGGSSSTTSSSSTTAVGTTAPGNTTSTGPYTSTPNGSPPLARTGQPLDRWMWSGIVAIAAGAVAIALSRRARRANLS
jgi:hypothetical protein